MEKSPLTKHQLCWVLIRVAGILILLSILRDIVTVVNYDSLTDEASIILKLGFVVKCVVGILLLTRGEGVHWLLMRESSGKKFQKPKFSSPGKKYRTRNETKPQKPTINSISPPTGSEATKDFKIWLSQNPQFSKHDTDDQITLFHEHLSEEE